MDKYEFIVSEAIDEFRIQHQVEIDYDVREAMIGQAINLRLTRGEVGRFERMLRVNLLIELLIDTGRWN